MTGLREEHRHRGEHDRQHPARYQFQPAKRPGGRNALEAELRGEKMVAEEACNHPGKVTAEDLTEGISFISVQGKDESCRTQTGEKERFGRGPGSKCRDGK